MKLVLKGIGASPGKATGRVRIIRGIGDYSRFLDGEILVTRITDPSMTVMMNKAAAIICDMGGLMSHPSILARELGVPCIVNTKNGTTKLKEGMKVSVDGLKGEIYEI
ncbi:MAG: PEP-utilizing enzyme [Candidatus Micrarchaeota archaeon]